MLNNHICNLVNIRDTESQATEEIRVTHPMETQTQKQDYEIQLFITGHLFADEIH